MSQTGASTSNGLSALAGRFVLQPGHSTAIAGARPIAAADLLSRLLKGQHFAATQARLGHVFTLCAHAHQRACALVFGTKPPPLALLRWETARDHLRTIALEWPQRLGEPSLQGEAMNWLRTCPISLAGARQPSASEVWASLASLHNWLEQHACFPTQCLARWHAQGEDLAEPLHPLDVLNADLATQEQQLRLLGQAIATHPDFTYSPQWQGACAETGPWTRLRHAQQPTSAQTVSAWTRLQARWQELLDLAAAPALADDASHDPLLCCGALELGDGQAIAWCEMARGLLLHWLQRDAHGAVAQYRVIAPTEWNFHPQGALALALAACAPQDFTAAQTLAAAFDPCVECSVVGLPALEVSHA
jgi:hypothetical protein